MGFVNPRAYTPEEFRAYVSTIRWTGWKPDCVVLHNTGAPSLVQWMHNGIGKDSGLQRCRNLNHYYQSEKGWSTGPHLFIAPDFIFQTCDLKAYGIHASCFNRHSLGVEMIGDYGSEPFGVGDSAKVKNNAAAALRILFDALHITPSATTLKFHRECIADHHLCPGDNVHKVDMLKAIMDYGRPVLPQHEDVAHDGMAHISDHAAPAPPTPSAAVPSVNTGIVPSSAGGSPPPQPVAEKKIVAPTSAHTGLVGGAHYYNWQIDTARQIYDYFNGKLAPSGHKLQPCHAAAFVEMMDAESSFKPDVWGDDDSAYGLWQPYPDRLGRACKALGLSIPIIGNGVTLTVEQQLDCVWFDITSKEEAPFKALEKLLMTTSPFEAGVTLCFRWERAKSPGQRKKRGDGAEMWFKYLTTPVQGLTT